MLALDDLAQRRAGIAPVPTWLYLAVEDGGFTRSGFWLREVQGERFVPDAYVDLVVDVDTVANGGFECRPRQIDSDMTSKLAEMVRAMEKAGAYSRE